MQDEGQFPLVRSGNAFNIIGLLKACAAQKDLRKGLKLHAFILEHKCLERNSHVASTLVNMYAKCGALAKAEQVLKQLPVRDVVTWSALIAGYAQQGQGEEALNCFDSMQHEGHPPDAITFTCALKACGSIGAVAKGEEIHEKIVTLGLLEKDIVLGNTLVDMYAKCGALSKARQVLEELPVRNVITWSVLIAGYAQQGQGEEALKCFDNMQQEGHCPDKVTYLSALKACASIGAAAKGEQIHDKIASSGILDKDIVLGSALVDMYAKSGALAKAQQVLEGLPGRDMVIWSTLIAGYAQQGQGEEALKCFERMQHEGHSPNVVTLTCALKACASIGAAAKGEQVHDKILSLGMLEKDVMLGSTLVDMYVKCGALSKARQVLEELPVRNLFTWNALMVGYVQDGQGKEALRCYESMQREGHFPDEATFICALKACASIGATAKGEEIHDKLDSLSMLEKNIVLGNTLVDMYAKCGALAKAKKVLEELPLRDDVTWSSLIVGYVQQGQTEEALKCFDNMQCEGHSPNLVTFIYALKACGSVRAAVKGEQIHDKIVTSGLLKNSIALGNTLVDMYAKCGALGKAQRVLEDLPVRNTITWNALIAGYAQQGQGEEALKCFDSMQCEGHTPAEVTFICALKACGNIGAAGKGEEIHDKIISLGILDKDIVLGSTLVDMYSKCGALAKVQQVLESLPVQDAITWSALISGYAQQGQSWEAFQCFKKMISRRVKPDLTTLSSLLNACSHSGLLDKGKSVFLRMSIQHDIKPVTEHYCCMIDLFGRAGNLNYALSVIEKMASADYLQVWVALLGACHKWGAVKIGKFAFEHALHLDKSKGALYICMTNIYTAAGLQEEADMIEVMRFANEAY